MADFTIRVKPEFLALVQSRDRTNPAQDIIIIIQKPPVVPDNFGEGEEQRVSSDSQLGNA